MSGTVLDAATGQPLPACIVTLQATETRSACRSDGMFDLVADGPGLVVVAAAVGYANAAITVDGPASGVVLELAAVIDEDSPDFVVPDTEACSVCHTVSTDGSGLERAPYPASLTDREEEVLVYLSRGFTNKQRAEELVLSARTVERHIQNAYAKIGAHTRAQATAFVLEHGLDVRTRLPRGRS